ncbi:MAG: nucleotidyltransferase substrate binding protein [Candidatus Sumerlaeaceae bacterium]|nr:nucleotidyltransferase substrate binding protein [Candidatus Sumerlaeaceae bacterium]
MSNDLRWKQRLENFEKAYSLLCDALKDGEEKLSDLEKEGVVQRFEYTFELAWKTMRDFLLYGGTQLVQITPRAVIKEAFKAGVIPDGQVWIDMLEHRNLMSHTYDKAVFAETVRQIRARYILAMGEMLSFFRRSSNS